MTEEKKESAVNENFISLPIQGERGSSNRRTGRSNIEFLVESFQGEQYRAKKSFKTPTSHKRSYKRGEFKFHLPCRHSREDSSCSTYDESCVRATEMAYGCPESLAVHVS